MANLDPYGKPINPLLRDHSNADGVRSPQDQPPPHGSTSATRYLERRRRITETEMRKLEETLRLLADELGIYNMSFATFARSLFLASANRIKPRIGSVRPPAVKQAANEDRVSTAKFE